MSLLPWPTNPDEIHEILTGIDVNLLKSSEKFIRQQLSRPINHLISHQAAFYDSDTSESFWLNVLSLFNANQQLNEACNKMWASVELANVTRGAVWKKKYMPIGSDFGRIFVSGTLIPTLYYAQISAMISILSSFGCIPILEHGTPFYLVRTREGWKAFIRRNYIKTVFGKRISGWHDQVIETYFSLISKGVSLPKLSKSKMNVLKEVRNEVHYGVLGDLKMWRIVQRHDAYAKFVPLVDKTIVASMDILNHIKEVTTNCDDRYSTLRLGMKNQLGLL